MAKGESGLDETLRPEEQALLEEISDYIRKIDSMGPEKPKTAAFTFTDETKRAVYGNLIDRLALRMIAGEIGLKKEGGSGLSTEEFSEIMRLYGVRYAKAKIDDVDLNQDLELAHDELDPLVGESFDGHGINKGTSKEQLQRLLYILDQGPDPKRPFHTMNLKTRHGNQAAAIGAANPYTTGGFILLSEPGSTLAEKIKYVLVNDSFYEAIPILQSKYPDVEFIKATEMPKRLKEIIEASEIQKK